MKITEHVYLVGSGHYGLSHSFDCSVFVVDCGGPLAMIDAGAGCGTETIVANMEKDGLDANGLSLLLLTHGHSDHAGGARFFQERFGCMVHLGAPEADMVEKGDEKELSLDVAVKSGFYSPDYRFTPCRIDVRLHHGQTLPCGGLTFTALHVPGHSPGSFCYVVDLPEGRALFSGDAVFPEGVIGMLNCDGSELSDYREHIHRLSGLDADMLFPGHRVFVLSGGQSHVEQAIDALGRLQLPRNFI
jgi:hydroxyacylglutathione hydrolase